MNCYVIMLSDGEAERSAEGREQSGSGAPGGGTVDEDDPGDERDANDGADVEAPGASDPDDPVASASGDAESGVESISQDDIFDVLSNRRRRLLLQYLRRHDGETVELSSVSSQLAAWEQGTSPASISYADRKNVHTALYQFHLPKMAEVGFVDYDRRSGEIELTDAARRLDVYLETDAGCEKPWRNYFLGLSSVSTLLALAAWSGTTPLSGLPTGELTFLVAVAFLASSVAFAYRSHLRSGEGATDPTVEWD